MGRFARAEGWTEFRGYEGEWIGPVEYSGRFDECGVSGRKGARLAER